MTWMQFSQRQRAIFFFGLFVLFSTCAIAEDMLSLYIENDSRMLKPNHKTDRHYTHGTKLVYTWDKDLDFSFDDLFFFTPNKSKSADTTDLAIGVFLGQNIYTPEYPAEPEKRNEKDMKFAGWLYTGIFSQYATDHTLDHLELSIGVIGPSSGAESSQKIIHEYVNADSPIGWDDQIGDELAVDLTYMRKQRILNGFLKPTDSSDVIAEYGFTLGSVHRHAQAGLTFRYGFNLGNTFGPGRLNLPAGISTFRKQENLSSGYLFARACAKAVEHNRFLTGLSEEPLVGEFQAGLVYQYKQLEIGYSQTFLTQEFEEQNGVDSYGAVTLSWIF